MATKKKEMDLKQLTVAELSHQAEKASEDLFRARFRMASATSKNTMQIRTLRRQIARLHTFINQKNSPRRADLPAKDPIAKGSNSRQAGGAN